MTEEKDKEETRRLADLHLQSQIPVMAYRIEALEKTIIEKFGNGIKHDFEKIHAKLDSLQCGVHVERMLAIKNEVQSLKGVVKWIYGILAGVIIGLLINYFSKGNHHEMAEKVYTEPNYQTDIKR